MCASKIFFGYLLLVLNIAFMFFLNNKITNPIGELVFILLAIVFAFILLKGFYDNSVWVWPAMIVFLAVSLANGVYLFAVSKQLNIFLATVLLNLFGMVFSIIWSVEDERVVKEKDGFTDYSALPQITFESNKKDTKYKKKVKNKSKNKKNKKNNEK